jgi:PAS domain S-box-containing protein
MDLESWLLPLAILGPLLVAAVALAWVLATRLRRVSAEIDERVRARTSELAESERQHRRLIEDSAEGILIHRLGLIRYANAAALRLFGFADSAHAVGQPWLDLIAPDNREMVTTRVNARLRGESVPVTAELEALRRDGSHFWLAATATVVEWEGGPATLVSFVDISDRQRREAAEREAESLRSVTKLANAAAHEINNPLTVVSGNLQLLTERLGDRPELTRYLERGDRAVRQIAEMISHMTRITRLTPLTGVDTGGVPTLDLRRSSEPGPPAGPGAAGGDAPVAAPKPDTGIAP